MIDERTSWNSGSLFSLVFVKHETPLPPSCARRSSSIYLHYETCKLAVTSSNYDHGIVITPIKVLPLVKAVYHPGCLLPRRFEVELKRFNNSKSKPPTILICIRAFFYTLLLFSMSRTDPPSPLVFHECINLHFCSFNLNRSRYQLDQKCKSRRSLVFQMLLPSQWFARLRTVPSSYNFNRGR